MQQLILYKAPSPHLGDSKHSLLPHTLHLSGRRGFAGKGVCAAEAAATKRRGQQDQEAVQAQGSAIPTNRSCRP